MSITAITVRIPKLIVLLFLSTIKTKWYEFYNVHNKLHLTHYQLTNQLDSKYFVNNCKEKLESSEIQNTIMCV